MSFSKQVASGKKEDLHYFPIFNKNYATKQTKRPNYELVLGDSPITTEDLRSSLQKKNKFGPTELHSRRIASLPDSKVHLRIDQKDPNNQTEVLLPSEKIWKTKIAELNEDMLERTAADTWWIQLCGKISQIKQKPSTKLPAWRFVLDDGSNQEGIPCLMFSDPCLISAKEVIIGRAQNFIGKLRMEEEDESFFLHCFWVYPVPEGSAATPLPWEAEP